jgi:polyphosphate kinase
MPVLTPIGLDPAHPFPRILNKSLNFAVQLSGKDAFGRKLDAALVQAPRVLPRVIRLPREIADCDHGFVFLSSVIHAHVGELFSGMEVLGCYQFPRDAQQRSVRRRGRGEKPAHRAAG